MSKKPAKGKKTTKKQGRANNYKNIAGQGFHTNPERINKKGRPRKLLTEFNAEMQAQGFARITESQLIESYEVLLALPKDQVIKISRSTTLPYYLTRVAKWMGEANGLRMIESMFDRAYGKAMMRANMDVGVKQEQPLFPDVKAPVKK